MAGTKLIHGKHPRNAARAKVYKGWSSGILKSAADDLKARGRHACPLAEWWDLTSRMLQTGMVGPLSAEQRADTGGYIARMIASEGWKHEIQGDFLVIWDPAWVDHGTQPRLL